MTMKCNPTNILRLLETTYKQDAQADAAAEPVQLLVAVHPSKLDAFQKVACAMGLKVMVL